MVKLLQYPLTKGISIINREFGNHIKRPTWIWAKYTIDAIKA